MGQWKEAARARLYQALLSLKNQRECAAFLEDLCTIQELNDMVNRLEAARLLSGGANYQEVAGQTGMSTATISRVNRCLRYGAGGYQAVLKRMAAQASSNQEVADAD